LCCIGCGSGTASDLVRFFLVDPVPDSTVSGSFVLVALFLLGDFLSLSSDFVVVATVTFFAK
jgi:hypothetical protein